MKEMWFSPSSDRKPFSFQIDDDAIPLEVRGPCLLHRRCRVEVVDLENMTFRCMRGVWSPIPKNAFHMMPANNVDGYEPVYWHRRLPKAIAGAK